MTKTVDTKCFDLAMEVSEDEIKSVVSRLDFHSDRQIVERMAYWLKAKDTALKALHKLLREATAAVGVEGCHQLPARLDLGEVTTGDLEPVDEGFITFGDDGEIHVSGPNAAVVATEIVHRWNRG